MFTSLAVLAQIVAPTPVPSGDEFDWTLSAIKWIVEQFQGGNYALGAGMIIMVLVFLASKLLKDKLTSGKLPWVSALIGVATTCGVNLLALNNGYTAKDWLTAVVSGVVLGASASGLWSLIGKWVMAKIDQLVAKLQKKQ